MVKPLVVDTKSPDNTERFVFAILIINPELVDASPSVAMLKAIDVMLPALKPIACNSEAVKTVCIL